MSKADLVVFYAHTDLKAQYKLGNEAYYDIYGEPSADPLASDCSGLVIGVFQRAGVLIGGKSLASFLGTIRATAHVMYKHAVSIPAPVNVGDLFFRVDRDGHAYHVGIYVGNGMTIESGDGTGKTGKHTVGWQNDRGVVWGRFSGNDIGAVNKVSPSLPDWPDMYLGSYGRHVRELKTILNYVMGCSLTTGYSAVGNTFGPNTLSWVKKFQATHPKPNGQPFERTGRVGPATKGAMVKVLL